LCIYSAGFQLSLAVVHLNIHIADSKRYDFIGSRTGTRRRFKNSRTKSAGRVMVFNRYISIIGINSEIILLSKGLANRAFITVTSILSAFNDWAAFNASKTVLP
jgi:hypothetical protein